MMATERKTAVETALDTAQELRLRIVKCRFERYDETHLLDKASDIIGAIERIAKPAAEEDGDKTP